MYSAAVFDMDGLLLDSERLIRDAWIQASLENGIAFSESVYLEVVGRNSADSTSILMDHIGDDLAFSKICAQADALMSERTISLGYQIKPGAIELLSLLNERNIPCCVASSTNRAEVRRRLQKAGLDGFFNAIAGGDEVLKRKPAPDLFLLAAGRIGVSPGHCLVFEDSEHGARGAIAAGMSAILVPDIKTPSAGVQAMCIKSMAGFIFNAGTNVSSWF